MKTLIALVAISAAGPVVAQVQAPFCLVSNNGHASCFYYSLDACRQASSSMGGMCAANVQQPIQTIAQPTYQAPIQQQMVNIAEAGQRGYEHGLRMRQAREEHEARMRLMEAQTNAVQTQSDSAGAESWSTAAQMGAAALAPVNGKVLYRCGIEGIATYTTQPSPGCVVISVSP